MACIMYLVLVVLFILISCHENQAALNSTENQLSNFCLTTNDCWINSICLNNSCQCQQGWFTRQYHAPCSYKQFSKISIFFSSFFFGCTGFDWFLLSRRNYLYILTGLLKFLLTLACCIWSRLAILKRRIPSSTSMADYLSIILAILSLTWWLIDWIRILFNNFPDGNSIFLY